MGVKLSAALGGSVELVPTNTASNYTLTLPASTGTVVTTTSPKTGNVIQVVNATYNTYSNTTSTSFVATGLTASITPSASSSKILVFASMVGLSKNANTATGLAVYKNGSSLFQFDDLACYNGGASSLATASSVTYLDSPATTSATTYAIYIKVAFNTGTIYWNNYGTLNGGTACTITLMEIAG